MVGRVMFLWSVSVVVTFEALNTTILSISINVLASYWPHSAGFAVKVRLCEPDVKPLVKYCRGINHTVSPKS